MKSETWVRVVERDIPFLIRNLIRKGECSPCFNRALGVDIPPIGDATIGNMVYSLRDSPKNVVVALGGMVEQSGYERIAEIRDSCIRTAGELHDFLRGVSGRDDLVHILEGFQERYAYLTSYLLVVVFSERFLEDRVRDLIARMAGEDKVDHYFDALVSVRCFNESTEELLALVSLVEKIIEQDLDSDGKRAREMYEAHATEYGWLATRWYFEQVWDADDIRKRVKEYLTKEPEEERKKILTIRREAEEKTEEFLEKYGLGEEDRSLIDLVKDFVFLRTFRTESLSKANFLVRPVLERVAKKLGISFKDILFLSVDEIIMTLQDDDGLDILKLIRKRKQGYYQILFEDEIYVFMGEEMGLIDESGLFRDHVDEDRKDINQIEDGQIAWPGIVSGRARIVKSVEDIGKVERGDIMVSVMTFPNFVPAMERASAFVTDEGGILCHAAIVAREMQKPCIVGTQNATRVLKDGDLVEVDAEAGVIRIVQRKR